MVNTNHLETKLAKGITVSDYLKLAKNKNKKNIANFIEARFTERYIAPLKSSTKSGFCTMAVCCLMIEALESFYNGWVNTEGRSERAFCSFFDRNEPLKDFRGNAKAFYKHVRCGILHQAETTGGWRIKRNGPLLDPDTRTINAEKFLKELELSLKRYTGELEGADWDNKLWENFRTKMDAVCNNCQATDGSRT